MKRVIVEFVEMKGLEENALFDSLSQRFDSIISIKVDEGYKPIPMKLGLNNFQPEENQQILLARAEIDENDIDQLESLPGVIKVWGDTKLSPHFPRKSNAGSHSPQASTASSAVSGSFDCNYRAPKGGLTEVMDAIGLRSLYDNLYNGNGIVIGIVDSGISNHELIYNIIGGFPGDFGTVSHWRSRCPGNDMRCGHGNMTAFDAQSMAPSCSLYDIRITEDLTQFEPEAYISQATQGFQWAIEQFHIDGSPHILSNSWGIYQELTEYDYATNPDHCFTRKVVEAIETGIIVLFSAGNCGNGCGRYPDPRCGSDVGSGRSIWGANGSPNVMTVGAVNTIDQLIGYSSWGPSSLAPMESKPDFCTISHFTGYYPRDFSPDTRCDSGTSASCAIAAGVIAVLKGAFPSATHAEIKSALQSSAVPVAGLAVPNEYIGYGLIDAQNTFNELSLIYP